MFNLSNKKILALLISVLTLLMPFSSLSIVNASQYEQNIDTEEISIKQNKDSISSKSEVVSLFIENKDITIEHQGKSEFIKIFGICKDNTQVNLTNEVTWTSNDNSVIWAYEGRILAVGQGVTTISVTYEEIIETIKVNVKNHVNLNNIFNEAYQSAINNTKNSSILQSTYLTSSQRDTYVTNARNMINMVWSGTNNKKIRGWRNEYTFLGGFPYTGMPYSQTLYQVDDNLFYQYLYDSSSGFYDDYTRFNIVMPKYGNDCSGFVSFSWGISRHITGDFIAGIRSGTFPKVGSYNAYSPSYSDLYNSYQNLQPGDAVVTAGHTFLIVASGNGLCFCYEQTPYYARATYWNWSDLASQGYMPFGRY